MCWVCLGWVFVVQDMWVGCGWGRVCLDWVRLECPGGLGGHGGLGGAGGPFGVPV